MTEITKTIPTHNPADIDSLDGMNNFLADKMSMNIQKVIPGIVQSYNPTTNRAVIKPAITGVASLGQKVSKSPLSDIPVLNLSGGGITLYFPIKTGDTGWLIACDRNISLFKQNLTESAPNDIRKHKYEDSFFIPDKINNIGVTDPTAFVISGGTTSISLKSGAIGITAATTAVTGNLTVSTGASGTFRSADNKTVTVVSGIITKIQQGT